MGDELYSEDLTLEILKLEDENYIIPQKMTTNGMPCSMGNIKGLILYQIQKGVGEEIKDVIKRLIGRATSYHYIIDSDGSIYETLEPIGCARHSRKLIYSRFANKIFGSVLAPIYRNTATSRHMSSPDAASVGVAFITDEKTGALTFESYRSLKNLIAYIFNKYTVGLDALNHLILDDNLSFDDLNFRPNESKVTVFINDKKYYIRFKQEIERLRHNWKAKYIEYIEEPDTNDPNYGAPGTEVTNEDGSVTIEYPPVKMIKKKISKGYPNIKYSTITFN